MIMRELMIKLIICLMIMFACVSCSSDDDYTEEPKQNEICLLEYIESYTQVEWNMQMTLNQKANYGKFGIWNCQQLNEYFLEHMPHDYVYDSKYNGYSCKVYVLRNDSVRVFEKVYNPQIFCVHHLED